MNNTITGTQNTQETNTTQSAPGKYVKFWDVASYAEPESIAFEKAFVLLEDVIDFLDALSQAIEDGDEQKALSLARSTNRARQKTYIIDDIVTGMNAQNEAFLSALFGEAYKK